MENMQTIEQVPVSELYRTEREMVQRMFSSELPGAGQAQMMSGKVYLLESDIFVQEGDFARALIESEAADTATSQSDSRPSRS